MAPRSAKIWKYFEDDPDNYTNALCTIPNCKHPKVSRGPDNCSKSNLAVSCLNAHVKTHHPREHKELLLEMKSDDVEKKRKAAEEEEADEMENKSLVDKKAKSQGTLDGYFGGLPSTSGDHYSFNDVRAKDRHRGILIMMVTDLQPFSFVEDVGFKAFCATMDRNFKPASKTFYRELTVKVYDRAVGKLQEKIARDDPPAVACQLDGWSANHHGYIGVLINYITAAWKRVNLNIACTKFDQRHTGENMALF